MEKKHGNDAIDLTETLERETEHEAVASCSVLTETLDEITDGVISIDLKDALVKSEVVVLALHTGDIKLHSKH